MNITKHFKRNISDTLINYNLDKNVYRFRRDVTLTYEHSNNFLLFNRIESLIVLLPKEIHYSKHSTSTIHQMILPKTFIPARTIKFVTLYDNQFVLDNPNPTLYKNAYMLFEKHKTDLIIALTRLDIEKILQLPIGTEY